MQPSKTISTLRDTARACVIVRGEEVQLDPSGVAYLPHHETLLVADLHFEKGSSYARRGQFLPPYDTSATLSALERAVSRFAPKRVVSLGDAFHDLGAEGRMAEQDAARLEILCRSCEWVWVLGNHDPAAPAVFLGRAVPAFEIGSLTLVHEPGEVDGWAMAGHLHPCARVSDGTYGVRRRCFVADGHRMILPSFGAYTGGLNVLDPAVGRTLARDFKTYALGRDNVFRVPRRNLRPDGVR